MVSHIAGSCLAQTIHRGLDLGGEQLAVKLAFTLQTLSLGTLCSGIDGCVVVFDFLAHKLHINCIRHVMSCEIAHWPRLFLLTYGRSTSLYSDICRLVTYDGRATDARLAPLGTLSVVPRAGILVAGTVCRQFSKLCDSGKRAKTCDDTNSTKTLSAFRDYVAKYKPSLIMLENVIQIGHWLTEVHLQFRSLGYLTYDRVIDPINFGLPEERPRRYFVAVLLNVPVSAARQSEFEACMDYFIKSCEMVPGTFTPPLCLYLLQDSHPLLEASSSSVTKNRRRQLGRTNSWLEEHYVHSAHATGPPKSAEAVAFTAEQIDELMSAPGVCCLPDREQDIVRLKAKEFGSFLYGRTITVSTTLQFGHCPSLAVRAHTLTCGVRFFDFNLRRIWHGFEHFKIQLGVDSDLAVESLYPSLQTNFLDAQLRHMAGDGFALPAFAVFFLAIIYSLHKEEVESLV